MMMTGVVLSQTGRRKRWEALGDGVAEATVNINHEYREPADKQRSAEWFAKQQLKIDRSLALMEKDLGGNEFCFGKKCCANNHHEHCACNSSRTAEAVLTNVNSSFLEQAG
jgi:hypothetical protein